MPFYLGKRSEDDLILFHAAFPPTKHTHGHLYKAVIGPFRKPCWSGVLRTLRKKQSKHPYRC